MRVLTLTAALLLLGAVPALAGGWAATTLDELPGEFVAGDTYQIGYTIKQHGVTPVNVDELGGKTEIRITSPQSGKTLAYQGVREGATGHYIAKVTFPYEGKWTWEVTQGPFQAQPLGSISVKPAGVAAQGGAAQAAPAPATRTDPLLGVALVLATAGAAILFGTRLVTFARRRAAA